MAPARFAPSRFAPSRSDPRRSASRRSAPRRSIPCAWIEASRAPTSPVRCCSRQDKTRRRASWSVCCQHLRSSPKDPAWNRAGAKHPPYVQAFEVDSIWPGVRINNLRAVGTCPAILEQLSIETRLPGDSPSAHRRPDAGIRECLSLAPYLPTRPSAGSLKEPALLTLAVGGLAHWPPSASER